MRGPAFVLSACAVLATATVIDTWARLRARLDWPVTPGVCERLTEPDRSRESLLLGGAPGPSEGEDALRRWVEARCPAVAATPHAVTPEGALDFAGGPPRDLQAVPGRGLVLSEKAP